MVKRYNDIYRVQMPNITPHVCRYTYCSNMEKSGMNPKTLRYLMGYSDLGVTLNTYTHLGLEDVTDEQRRMEDLENARKELEKNKQGEARFTEDVSGNLNKESLCALLRQGIFFVFFYTTMGRFMLKYQGSKCFELLMLNNVRYGLRFLTILYFRIMNEK